MIRPKKSALLYTLLLVVIISLPVGGSLISSVTISSSGTIISNANINPLALHTEGSKIKDSLNNTVVLRGIWAGAFVDSSTGWWGDAYTWNEAALRSTLSNLKNNWGVNCINFFVWGDWWLQNKATTLGGYSTNIGCRDAIINTVNIASEYGIYTQIRLYGASQAEGRREGIPYAPNYAWSTADFTNFWVNVSSTLKNNPNVIYTMFDEPTGDSATMANYYAVCNQTIVAMRQTGANQLAVVHAYYCGDVTWIKNYVNAGYTLDNVVFSEHVYRDAGTFAYNPSSPTDLNYTRNYFTGTLNPYSYNCTATRYIRDTYNVPIWVSAIGAMNGVTSDDYYNSFKNTLIVLNELGIGYIVYTGFRTGTAWAVVNNQGTTITYDSPNRVGQALIDAIAGNIT